MSKNQRATKIDLMIIGTQKAGTSALLALLQQHPEIQTHFTNEFSYFHDPTLASTEFESYFHNVYQELKDESTVIAKCVGVLEFPKAIEKLNQHNPKAVISVVLRDPIERAYSAFWFARSRGWEPESSFSKAIRMVDRFPNDPVKYWVCNYAKRGLYYDRLLNVEQYFPQSQTIISEYGDLKKDSVSLCNNIFDKLQLPNYDVQNHQKNKTTTVRSVRLSRLFLAAKRNSHMQSLSRRFVPRKLAHSVSKSFLHYNKRESSPIPAMKRSDHEWLADFYREPNENLKRKYGIDFNTHYNN